MRKKMMENSKRSEQLLPRPKQWPVCLKLSIQLTAGSSFRIVSKLTHKLIWGSDGLSELFRNSDFKICWFWNGKIQRIVGNLGQSQLRQGCVLTSVSPRIYLGHASFKFFRKLVIFLVSRNEYNENFYSGSLTKTWSKWVQKAFTHLVVL